MDENNRYLETYYVRNGEIFKCVGIITNPAIVLENIKTGEQETHVIGCLNYQQFKRLIEDK